MNITQKSLIDLIPTPPKQEGRVSPVFAPKLSGFTECQPSLMSHVLSIGLQLVLLLSFLVFDLPA